MTIYAKIEDGIVSNIIVAEESYVSTLVENYVKVTDSTNDVAIGHEYDANKNKFKAPQPFESWTLNPDTLLWEAPVAKPAGATLWDEVDQSWIIPE
jgi:hypothetical protein